MEKRTLLFLLLAVVLFDPCTAQKNSYGLAIGTGKGAVLTGPVDGAPGYDVNLGFSIGLQFNRNLTDRLQFNSGLTWYGNNISVRPMFHPGIDMTSKDYKLQLLYIPIFLRAYLSKHVFLNGGLIADIDISKDHYIAQQSGLGAGVGIGGRARISKKISLELNPYLNLHGLILVRADRYPERILDSGIKLSLVLHEKE